MIDLSKLKAPGWQRVVAELSSPAPDDATFLAKLTGALGQVSGARQSVLHAIAPGGGAGESTVRVMQVWPVQPSTGGPQVDEPSDAQAAARSAAESGQVRVFGLRGSGSGDRADAFYDGGQPRGYVVGVPLTQGGADGAQAVVTLLLEPRSQQALQTTLALVEVLAGYVHGHAARQQLRRARSATAALDLAGRLIASINSAKGFKGAVLQLVNDLARFTKADRASVGWVRGVGASGATRLAAISDTEHLDRRMAMAQKLEAAMDECLDQRQPLAYPPPPQEGEGGDVVLAQGITRAHRELAAHDANLRVASIPLRVDDSIVGVVTVEAGGGGTIDVGQIELLQATMDLVAPVLSLRRSDDRPLPVRAWASTLKAASWAVGPKHTAWKLAALAVLVGAVTVTFVRVPYRIDAPLEILPREERKVAAPFRGIIRSLPEGIVPGAEIQAGQVLLELDANEFQLQAIAARGEVNQALAERDAALRENKLGEAQQAEARASKSRANLELLEYFIRESSIKAPISGTIVAGDLRDRVGSAVQLGDPLFQIAKLDDMVVSARVKDADIGLIQVGGKGEVATKAYPALAWPVTIERIIPLAQAEEGNNAFEVRAALSVPAGELVKRGIRPGSEGLAKFETGDRTLLDIGTRRIRDTLRLWLWW